MLNILGRSMDHGFEEPLGLLSDCHRRIEAFLGLLLKVARDCKGRSLSPETIEALARARRYFAEAAPKHTADEEKSLFPRLRAAATTRGVSCEAIGRLEADHQQADELQASANRLFDRWLAEGQLDATASVDLFQTIERLEALYRAHIHEEDHVVFPLAAELLDRNELARIGEEMRSRRGLAEPHAPG